MSVAATQDIPNAEGRRLGAHLVPGSTRQEEIAL